MKDKAADKIKDLFEDLKNDKKALVKLLSVVMILMMALVLRVHAANKADITVEAAAAEQKTASEQDESETESESDFSILYIDIGGAVVTPGVYQVTEGTRLYQVIEMAGGITKEADTDAVNRASFVEDGQKVIIPVKGSPEAAAQAETLNTGSPASPDIRLININTAAKEELTTLNGIGDVIAERIIEYRSGNSFKNKEDIMSVKGIGSGTYEKIKDDITC